MNFENENYLMYLFGINIIFLKLISVKIIRVWENVLRLGLLLLLSKYKYMGYRVLSFNRLIIL